VTVCRVSKWLIVQRHKSGDASKMADDLSNRGPADRARINVHEPHEVKYWTKALGVSEEKLKDAVAKVGVMADAVRKHLGK
jgi:Protein of unknown function (DUF3606)